MVRLAQDPDARRLAAVGVYFIAAMIFWAIFEQAGTTLSLFADTLTRNELSGSVSVGLVSVGQPDFRHPADAVRRCAVAQARHASRRRQSSSRSGWYSSRCRFC